MKPYRQILYEFFKELLTSGNSMVFGASDHSHSVHGICESSEGFGALL